ncbi:MAG: bifunctional diaminohydroxyphosphoribosylaminopyrimidine deaminase/5-amino-6-(5-phosphoribosylamino)uracil reductase RibD [Gammaproteobacteria bacterium]|nr:bifunctional diaminohydroxyphosphoribosylaminopyrimidine deaminase/5-amino-6-(5-phosphoribosylamino)uracil reductase RibD [Gammaproteobacteria bacterium]
MKSHHYYYLLKALELAKCHRGFCAPNPSVGAVIVDGSGAIIAHGYHNGPHTAHAEVDALTQLNQSPTPDMTLYVTLEPCNHYGRTPPCTKAIIDSGIRHVVFAYQDPNPIVAGQGAAQLKQAGITCVYIALPEIQSFYKSYHHWHRHQLPFVTAKIAMTLNHLIAGEEGEPLQITGKDLQHLTHQFRQSSDAILTTAKTILRDDPSLNARVENKIFPKKLYILDRHLSITHDARIFSSAKSVTLFYSSQITSRHPIHSSKCPIHYIPIEERNNTLDLHHILEVIGADGIHDLWVEAGGTLLTSFLQKNLVQTILFYIAPIVLSKGQKAFENFTFNFNDHPIHWQQYGKDVVAQIALDFKN